MDVNSSPEFEGVESASGVDVANHIITFIERHTKPERTRDSIPG
jgi:ribosomal protein S6--L-glutamate ligase